MNRAWNILRRLGLTRTVLLVFLIFIWGVSLFGTELDFSILFSDCLVRTGMNGVLVLALVPAVRGGVGLNFGIPLGIVCGLLGMVLLMDADIRGASSMFGAMVLGGGIGAIAGFLYARLLERVKGQEMMVGIYVGFAAVAGASIFWLMVPVRNPELVWPLGGAGLRNTLVLKDYYTQLLDHFGSIPLGRGFIPTGLLLFWLSCCGLMTLFL